MQSLYGRITKYFYDREYGFIRGEDNNIYFIHHSKLNGEQIAPGYYVYFKPFQNDRSDYNARILLIAAIELYKIINSHAAYNSIYIINLINFAILAVF